MEKQIDLFLHVAGFDFFKHSYVYEHVDWKTQYFRMSVPLRLMYRSKAIQFKF